MDRKRVGRDSKPKGGVVLSGEDRDKLRIEVAKGVRLREARRDEAKRRLTMDISVDSGEACAACGGAITYTSTKKFINTGPMLFGNGPAAGYWRETNKTSCSECALTYNHQHQRFAAARKEVAVWRSPPGDDWEPPSKEK